MRKLLVMLLGILILVSCVKRPYYIGKWVGETISHKGEKAYIPVSITEDSIKFLGGKKGECYKYVSNKMGNKIRIEPVNSEDFIMEYYNDNNIIKLKFKKYVDTISLVKITEEEYDSIMEPYYKVRQKLERYLIETNMKIIQAILDTISVNNEGIYPSSDREMETVVKKELPSVFKNPFNEYKPAYYYGTEPPKWSKDRIGAVYVQYKKDGTGYKIYGYGYEDMLDLTLVSPW